MNLTERFRALETRMGVNTGYFYALVGYFCYAVYDFKIRDSGKIPTFQLMFYRATLNVVISNIYVKMGNIPMNLKLTNVNRMLFIRSIISVTSSFFAIYGFQRANLSEGTALCQVAPVITALLGVTMLKESYDFAQIIITAMSVVGVLFIVKPGGLFGGSEVAVDATNETHFIGNLSILFSMLCFAFGTILARRIAVYKINSQVTNLYAGTILSLVAGPGMLIFGLKSLDSYEIRNVAMICTVSFGANYFTLRAINYGDAGKISLMAYSQIPFGCLFDIVYFNTVLDAFSSVGVFLIFACLFVQIFKKKLAEYIKGKASSEKE